MQIHEKYNLTPFVADIGFCQDKDGHDISVGILKTTFCFSDNGQLSVPDKEDMLPVFLIDKYYDKPDNSSLQYPSDIVCKKNGTDVIINGHVYGQNQKKTEAGFRIGSLEKIISVFGPRRWEKLMASKKISDPIPFFKIPLKYENAYGGFYEDDKGSHFKYEFNPIGVGYTSKQENNHLLPNLEYPHSRIESIKDKPQPAAFGSVPSGWKQRSRFAGTFDDSWSKYRRPLFPLDFDENFYNTVPDDQIFKPKLKGGEKLLLINLHPQKTVVQLEIPVMNFMAVFRIKERTERIPMAIDTLLIEPDKSCFSMTYRSTCMLENDFQFLKTVHFEKA